MQTQIITTELIFTHAGDSIRLYVNLGRLAVQKDVGGAWVTVMDWGKPGNPVNEFRWIVDGGLLKIQQLRLGGAWTGAEGIDFDSVGIFNPI